MQQSNLLQECATQRTIRSPSKAMEGPWLQEQQATLEGYHTQSMVGQASNHEYPIPSKRCQTISELPMTVGTQKGLCGPPRQTLECPTCISRLHDSGLHIYDPNSEQLSFLNTVGDNKEGFTKKRQLEGAELARRLYAKLAFPSIKGF